MRERWGVEREQQDARYRLSFTVGGLLMPQGVVCARRFVDSHPRPDAPDAPVGESIVSIRDEVVDSNALAIRTVSANKRVTAEVCKRLSALSYAELGFLASDDASPQDRRYLMWIAMCRYYLFIGEFASEVLRERFLLGETISYADYDRFVLDRASWHPELESLSAATATKLRSNLFKAMREAELTVRDSHGADVPVTAVPGSTLAALLEPHADSLRFLPSRDSMN
ncbi:BrxA family protein [Bifidobacterium sp. AGR2158]|uniref:BrxA family protein n=1 Tax=Bifidobacterium sp. AGR2158 TaxID=1280675 RepID=UPI00041B3C33|nr:BrxA family protein [Bifidobacterium sp. AGR2158]